MRKNQINFLLIVFFVAVTASCKKDTIIVDNIRDEVNPVLALSKNWYSEETAKIKNQQNDINPILGISKIDWINEPVYKDENVIVTATNFKNEFFKKYLKITLAENGTVKNESFLYIYFDKSSKVNINNFKLDSDFINKRIAPNNFTGTIIEYDLSFKKLSSLDYINGVENDIIKHKIDFKKQVLNNNRIDTNKILPEIYGRCVEWFWVTYNTYTGEVISVQHAFFVCDGMCEDPYGVEGSAGTNDCGTGGGTGGGGGGDYIPAVAGTLDFNNTTTHVVFYAGDWSLWNIHHAEGLIFPEDRTKNYFTSNSYRGYNWHNSHLAGGGLNGWHLSQSYCTWSSGTHSEQLQNNNKTLYVSGNDVYLFPNPSPVYQSYSNTMYKYARTDLQ